MDILTNNRMETPATFLGGVICIVFSLKGEFESNFQSQFVPYFLTYKPGFFS